MKFLENHKLLIHIGMPKTGTTSLQHFLFENNEILHSKGWDYPNISSKVPLRDYKSREKLFFINGWGLRVTCEKSDDLSKKQFNDIMNYLLECLEKYDVIVSCESLWYTDLKQFLEKIKSFYKNIKVLVYIRRQDKIIESLWNEYIKNDISRFHVLKEINEFYSEYLNYLFKIQQIEEIVGSKNIIVRIFEKEAFEPVGKNGDIISDFLTVLRLSDILKDCKPAKRFNDRLSNYLVEAKRLFNMSFFTTKLNETMIEERRKVFLAAEFSDLFLDIEQELKDQGESISDGVLSPQERTKILKQYEEGNREIARRYFGREELFSDMNVELPYTYYEATKFEKVMMRVIHALLKEYETRQEEREKIEFQIKAMEYGILEKKLAYFGGGQICQEFISTKKYPVSVIIDNKKSGELNGVPIVLSKDITNWKEYVIIITCEFYKEIEAQLQSYGLKENVDYIRWYNLLPMTFPCS